MKVKIQGPYYLIGSLDLFFLSKRALTSTCGSTISFSWDRAFSYYRMHRFKVNYPHAPHTQKSGVYSLCVHAMPSTRDTKIHIKYIRTSLATEVSIIPPGTFICQQLLSYNGMSTIVKICARDTWQGWGGAWNTWWVRAPGL